MFNLCRAARAYISGQDTDAMHYSVPCHHAVAMLKRSDVVICLKLPRHSMGFMVIFIRECKTGLALATEILNEINDTGLSNNDWS